MKSIITSILVCVFIVISGFQAFGEEWSAEQKEVWEAVERHWEFFKKGDMEALRSNFHDKVLDLWGDNPTPLNRDQIESGNKVLIGYYVYTYIDLKPVAINVVNNVANVFYIYKRESKNREYLQRGRTMTTMVKENNQWIIVGRFSASCDQKAPCPYGW